MKKTIAEVIAALREVRNDSRFLGLLRRVALASKGDGDLYASCLYALEAYAPYETQHDDNRLDTVIERLEKEVQWDEVRRTRLEARLSEEILGVVWLRANNTWAFELWSNYNRNEPIFFRREFESLDLAKRDCIAEWKRLYPEVTTGPDADIPF